MAKQYETESSHPNMILAGTTIKGDLESNGDIRFDGSLIGNASTKGRLIVGGTGMIKGEIICKYADVEGKIEGKITVTDLLTLKSTSIIEGDIVAKRLAIEPGARFTGSCSMTESNGQQQATTKTTAEVKK